MVNIRIPGRTNSVAMLLAGLACAAAARAELQIDITQGVTDPIPIAIVPLVKTAPGEGGFDYAAVVQRDLDGRDRKSVV